VPLTKAGVFHAKATATALNKAGKLDLVYHDWLSRDRDTARIICPITSETRGPRPWKMGKLFEGNPITAEGIRWAQWFVENPWVAPDFGGEPWSKWYDEWMAFLKSLPLDGRVGVVTHNRNIQAVLATHGGRFIPDEYNCDGPNFCWVYHYDGDAAERWVGEPLKNGVYLVRHGETSYGP